MQHCSDQLQQVSSSPSKRFPEDVARPHKNNNQEASVKIKEHNNGTPAHDNTGATINQRKTS